MDIYYTFNKVSKVTNDYQGCSQDFLEEGSDFKCIGEGLGASPELDLNENDAYSKFSLGK